METLELSGTVTALSSIAHSGGESLGITTKLRREKFVQPDGRVEEVPLISGNGMRGMLRDRGMLHFCRALGYGINEQTGEVAGLSLPAFYFLFSGGSLTAEGSKAIDLEAMRSLRQLIPLVGIFGGALGKQILSGKVSIGKLIPICAETAHVLPEAYRATATGSIWSCLQEEFYTRKDDEKNEHLRGLIDAPARGLLPGLTQALGPIKEGGPQQMMYYVETFATGTRFYWRIVLEDATPLEREAFLTCLVEFSKKPTIGGKAAVGLGQVAVHFDGWRAIDSRVTTGTAVDATVGSLYRTHLDRHRDEMRSRLGDIQ